MQDETRRIEAPVEIHVTAGDLNAVPILFANHIDAVLDPTTKLVYLTFSQYGPVPPGAVIQSEDTDQPVTLIAVPISRLVLPVERFKDWFESLQRAASVWFDPGFQEFFSGKRILVSGDPDVDDAPAGDEQSAEKASAPSTGNER